MCAVGDDTAYETQHIDGSEEHGSNEAALSVGQTELGTKEKSQYGIHNVVAETLSHVAEGGL